LAQPSSKQLPIWLQDNIERKKNNTTYINDIMRNNKWVQNPKRKGYGDEGIFNFDVILLPSFSTSK